jgi:hypothetical protein
MSSDKSTIHARGVLMLGSKASAVVTLLLQAAGDFLKI